MFTDGDVLFAPQTLRIALRHTLGRELDTCACCPRPCPAVIGKTPSPISWACCSSCRCAPGPWPATPAAPMPASAPSIWCEPAPIEPWADTKPCAPKSSTICAWAAP
nr:hypothetical protein [Methylogaea oryzae]